jgi:hypothetical protein
MAINKNHEFEELNGIRCAIVEKNASADRVSFLKNILDYNRYVTVVVASPPKPLPVTVPEGLAPEPLPETFTIGVTDLSFNPTNAIFGRMLKTPDGHIVSLAYWQEKESVSDDETPYFDKTN